jgi:acyl phosphate:glycerol-3-phosphate acyltransferase
MIFSVYNILILLAAYLLGSIPFSVIIGKLFYNTDVRQYGSGNPGATNMLRTLGPKAGLIVLILDIAKGIAAVFLAHLMENNGELSLQELESITGACAIAGHIFPVFLSFKGGKGVATAVGVIYAIQPLFGVIATLLFIVILVTTRYVSLGSILAAAIYPVLNVIFYKESTKGVLIFAIALALVIIIKHKANIQRLLKGGENKFVLKKKQQ